MHTHRAAMSDWRSSKGKIARRSSFGMRSAGGGGRGGGRDSVAGGDGGAPMRGSRMSTAVVVVVEFLAYPMVLFVVCKNLGLR